MRAIDADKLKEEFAKFYPVATNDFGHRINADIYDLIDNAPTVEVRSTLRPVIIHDPKMGNADAWYDDERQLVFYHSVTREFVYKMGWEIKEDI